MKIELDDKAKNRISYINWIIIGFARGFKRTIPEAYRYLKEFGGMDFLFRHYEIEHTESEINTHHTLLRICRKNGGWL